MVGEIKLKSQIKAIALADAVVPSGQVVGESGIVFVGARAGIMLKKIDEENILVSFDSNRDWSSRTFVVASLPAVGGKIYLDAAGNGLTKTASGNKFVGYFWGVAGGAVIFSLHS